MTLRVCDRARRFLARAMTFRRTCRWAPHRRLRVRRFCSALWGAIRRCTYCKARWRSLPPRMQNGQPVRPRTSLSKISTQHGMNCAGSAWSPSRTASASSASCGIPPTCWWTSRRTRCWHQVNRRRSPTRRWLPASLERNATASARMLAWWPMRRLATRLGGAEASIPCGRRSSPPHCSRRPTSRAICRLRRSSFSCRNFARARFRTG